MRSIVDGVDLRYASDFPVFPSLSVSTGIKGGQFHQFGRGQVAPDLVPVHTMA